MAETAKIIKKKKWCPIISPKIFNNAVLGETYVYDPNTMVGRSVSINLMNLTGDVKRQNFSVSFKVTDVQNNRANTKVVGLVMSPSSIKRMVRRGRDRIDMSFICTTSDKVNVRIKPLLITVSNASNSVLTVLRKKTLFFLVNEIKKMDYNTLVSEIVFHKIQNKLKDFINKVHPLKTYEIRQMHIASGEVLHKEEPAEAPKAEEPAKEEVKEEPVKEEISQEETLKKAKKPKKAKEEIVEEKPTEETVTQ